MAALPVRRRNSESGSRAHGRMTVVPRAPGAGFLDDPAGFRLHLVDVPAPSVGDQDGGIRDLVDGGEADPNAPVVSARSRLSPLATSRKL